MDSPLFSVVLTGRNDNYGGLFLKRLQLCINYFCYSMNRNNIEADFEIIVVDWCSDQPLSSAIVLSEEASKVTRFILVEPDLAKKFNTQGKNFNSPVALNTGAVRANGEFIIHMPADILFTCYSLSRLCEILKNSIPLTFSPADAIMLVKRYIIPSEFNETEKSYEEIDRYLSLTTNMLDYNMILNGICADFGALICKKEIWLENGGFDEDMTGWGKNDSRFGFIANVHYPIFELSGFGVNCYDPTVNNSNIKSKINSGNKSCDIDYTHRPQDIGLIKHTLKDYKTKNTTASGHVDETPCSYFANIDVSPSSALQQIKKLLPFNSTKILPYMYPLYWYMNNLPVNVFCEFIAGEDLRASNLADFMLEEDSAAALVSAVNPSAEIISIVPQRKNAPNTICHKVLGRQYLNKKSGKLGFIQTLFNELFPKDNLQHKWHPGFAAQKHHGLVQYITGKTDTAINRIRRRFSKHLRADLILFRTSEVSDPENTLNEILEFTSESGLIIIADSAESLLHKIPEIIGNDTTSLINPESNLALIFKCRNDQLTQYKDKKFLNDSKLWKKRTLPFNYLRGILFSTLISLKRKLER